MAENNDGLTAAVLTRTKATLGKIISKPPLTDKLLQRPPFKYLHDIVTEVIKTTGYFEGLFTAEELDHSKITNKEQKIAFLQKVIDVIIIVSGATIKARPAKIVAGHEADKTNEFLQVLSSVVSKKLDCSDAIQKVLRGEKPPEKEKRKRPAPSDGGKEKSTDRSKPAGSKSNPKPGEKTDKAENKPKKPADDREESQPDDKTKIDTVRSRPRAADKDGRRDPKEVLSSTSTKSTNDLSSSKTKLDSGSSSKDSKNKSRGSRKEKHRDKVLKEDEVQSSSATELKEQQVQPQLPNGDIDHDEDAGEIDRPAPARGKRRSHHSTTDPVQQTEPVRDNPLDQGTGSAVQLDDPPERPSSPPLPAMNMFPQGGRRPSSARPAPPKIVRHTDEEAPQDFRIASGNTRTNVILDNKNDDDEEKFFVEDPTVLPTPNEPVVVNGELADAKPEGALTKKMMLNKELLQGEVSQENSNIAEQPRISEAQRRKEKEMIAKEIDRLQSSIQGLCRSATPLGRIMDYVQEDMDSMLKELEVWQKENQQHNEALQRERIITDQELQPLTAQLEEIDGRLSQQVHLTRAVKANIFKNDERIQKMLSGMTLSSQT